MPRAGFKNDASGTEMMEQSISSAVKACMADGTSLAAPETDDQLSALATWLKYNDRKTVETKDSYLSNNL